MKTRGISCLAAIAILLTLTACAGPEITEQDSSMANAAALSRNYCVDARARGEAARMAAIAQMDPSQQGVAIMAEAMRAQAESLAGKTLRLNDDGTIPSDNPFIKTAAARPEIWSYGHRNAQGLAWQPGSGLMFQTEHGPSSFEGKGSGGDEVNIVEAGNNLGWPDIHHNEKREGMISPLLEYSPACAPGSGMFYNGSAFPAFKGNFFFGCLRGARITRVTLDGRRVTAQENLLEGIVGRIREMSEGPDGYIYFSTSNRDGRANPAKDDDRIMRLVPAK